MPAILLIAIRPKKWAPGVEFWKAAGNTVSQAGKRAPHGHAAAALVAGPLKERRFFRGGGREKCRIQPVA